MKMITLFQIQATNFVREHKKAMRDNGDRGAGIVEYGALVVLAGLLMVVLYTAFNGQLTEALGTAMTNLFEGTIE